VRLILSIFIFSILTGCQTLDSALTDMGVIKLQSSQFDDVERVVMSPAMTNHGMRTNADFGLRWNSDSGDYAILSVNLSTATSFDPAEPLRLKIDKEDISLQPASNKSYGNLDIKYDEVVLYYTVSSNDYVIHKDQVKQLVDGTEGFYRIHLPYNKVYEGDINYDYRGYQSYVVGAFDKFYQRVWGEQ